MTRSWLSEVRLVGDNVEMGVYPLAKAMGIARELELDLVEISPNASPPVCKSYRLQEVSVRTEKARKKFKGQSE